MGFEEEHVWVEHLSERRCWELLGAAPVGRVGVIVDSGPEIYPVNHRVEGETLVFRTDPGTKLRGIDRTPSVCFQVDGSDALARTGWSVLAKGRAVEVTDPAEVAHLAAVALELWGLGPKDHWVRIVVEEVTGRQIHQGRRAARRSGYL